MLATDIAEILNRKPLSAAANRTGADLIQPQGIFGPKVMIINELAGSGYALFESELANRVVYAEASLLGRMPIHIDEHSAAARDGEAFAREVRHALGW